MKITYFFKLLIIIIILCLLIILYLKFKEQFQSTNDIVSETNKPAKINFNLSTNKKKNKIILSWDRNVMATNYVIIMYINSDGPYFIDIKEYYKNNNIQNIKDILKLDYIYDAKTNIIYKFAVIGVNNVNNDYYYSEYDIKEIKLSILDTNISKANSFDLKVSCNPDGQHVIGSECVENTFPKLHSNIYNYELNTNESFNENNHNILMDELTYNKKYNFNF